jgi:drug/metabolite transporter (DMT)-like permease
VARVALSDAALLVYLGVFQIGLAYLCFVRGLRHVPALEASLLLMLEPVLNPIWTWVVHREEPHPCTWLGGVVVIGATLAHAVAGARGRTAGEGAA